MWVLRIQPRSSGKYGQCASQLSSLSLACHSLLCRPCCTEPRKESSSQSSHPHIRAQRNSFKAHLKEFGTHKPLALSHTYINAVEIIKKLVPFQSSMDEELCSRCHHHMAVPGRWRTSMCLWLRPSQSVYKSKCINTRWRAS